MGDWVKQKRARRLTVSLGALISSEAYPCVAVRSVAVHSSALVMSR